MSLNIKNTTFKSMVETMDEVITLLPESDIKTALKEAIYAKSENFQKIEEIFRNICHKRFDDVAVSTFFNSWKSTHLKMLPIYGLSCRLNTLATNESDEKKKLELLEASASNASTSHEDLGIGFDAITHGKLYDDFAYALLKSDEWKLSKYSVVEADEFSSWIYKGMVLNPLPFALCINMFSEFYNHAEYGYALDTFSYLLKHEYDLIDEEYANAIRYIDVHIEHETEIHHFLAVIDTIKKYESATGDIVSTDILKEVVTTYIDLITKAMVAINRHFS